MVLLTVKIRHMAVILPVMIMTVVTVKVAVDPLAVAVKTAQIALMILPHMDLSAVIRHGMNMEVTVLIWKAIITGIVPVVLALVIQPVNVVMAPAM